jgi:uncharacterized membrane protein
VNWFLLLKTIHILSAIVAVGANATYAIWGVLAKHEPQHLGFALRGIKFIDDRVANPSYGVLFVSGLIMALTHYSIGLRWIISGIVLFVVVALIAALGYTPTIKRPGRRRAGDRRLSQRRRTRPHDWHHHRRDPGADCWRDGVQAQPLARQI